MHGIIVVMTYLLFGSLVLAVQMLFWLFDHGTWARFRLLSPRYREEVKRHIAALSDSSVHISFAESLATELKYLDKDNLLTVLVYPFWGLSKMVALIIAPTSLLYRLMRLMTNNMAVVLPVSALTLIVSLACLLTVLIQHMHRVVDPSSVGKGAKLIFYTFYWISLAPLVLGAVILTRHSYGVISANLLAAVSAYSLFLVAALLQKLGDTTYLSHANVGAAGSDTPRGALYLRSFDDDRLSLYSPTLESISSSSVIHGPVLPRLRDTSLLTLLWPRVRLEALIGRFMGIAGVETVLVKDPRKAQKPTEGSTRVSMRGETQPWQDVVRHAASASRSVVVLLGLGDGLRQELDIIREAQLTGKTLFLLPPCGAAEVELRLRNLLAALSPDTQIPQTLLNHLIGIIPSSDSRKLILYLAPSRNWSAYMDMLAKHQEGFASPDRVQFMEGTYPGRKRGAFHERIVEGYFSSFTERLGLRTVAQGMFDEIRDSPNPPAAVKATLKKLDKVRALCQAGKHDKALNELVTLSKAIPLDDMCSRCCSSLRLADELLETGQAEKAAKTYCEASALAEGVEQIWICAERPPVTAVSFRYVCLARSYLSFSASEKTAVDTADGVVTKLSLSQRLCELAYRRNDVQYLGLALSVRGEALTEEASWDEAEEVLGEAITCFSQIGDRYSEGFCHTLLTGRPSMALDRSDIYSDYDSAITAFSDCGDQEQAGLVCMDAFEYAMNYHDYDRASRYEEQLAQFHALTDEDIWSAIDSH